MNSYSTYQSISKLIRKNGDILFEHNRYDFVEKLEEYFVKIGGRDLSNCVIYSKRAKGFKLQDIVFDNCDIIQTDFLESDLSGSYFTNCKITESNFQEVNLSSCVIIDSLLRDNNLIYTKINKSILTGSMFIDNKLKMGLYRNFSLNYLILFLTQIKTKK